VIEAATHRFFPEWAGRPVKPGTAPEADRNSYSAGGYAEEFGYGWQSGLPAPAPLLDGDPEICRYWYAQRGCLHPGYPECPKPVDRDWLLVDARDCDARSRRGSERAWVTRSAVPAFNVIRVGGSRREKGLRSGLYAALIAFFGSTRDQHRS